MEIKKELIIKTTPSKIFKAITDPQQLTQWFPYVASIEPKIGGKISFKFSKSNTDNVIQDHIVEGKIIELEKNRKIVYSWGYQDNSEFPPRAVKSIDSNGILSYIILVPLFVGPAAVSGIIASFFKTVKLQIIVWTVITLVF